MNVILFILGFLSGISLLLVWANVSSRRKAFESNDRAHALLEERNDIGRKQLYYLEKIANPIREVSIEVNRDVSLQLAYCIEEMKKCNGDRRFEHRIRQGEAALAKMKEGAK